MFGCSGRFWVGIADCGAHQSWIGGILVECRWCLGATPTVYQCLLLRCVLVALGRACICVIWCLRGILLVLRWHLSHFKPYFWWCMRGLLLVGVLLVLAWRFLVARRRHVRSYMGCILDISIVSCICAHGRATQHQTILHACGPWHLQRFPVLTGRACIGKRQLASSVMK